MFLAAGRGVKILLGDAAGSEVWELWDADSALLTLLAKARCYLQARPGRMQKQGGVTASCQPRPAPTAALSSRQVARWP